ncbi:major facilitator superfamily domain-containing protein [Xylogone sp. PMI_703]|nr:major facilitator superfamily domain-containing protein [Xylogone sp. PMI_703]
MLQLATLKDMTDQTTVEQGNSSNNDWGVSKYNPLNWSNNRKMTVVGLVSFQAFVSPLASSVMAPSLPEIGQHFHIDSPTTLALTLTIYLVAWAIGPMFLGPISELYGRRWVINFSSLFFTAFNIACIFAPSSGGLIAFRFLAGIGASTPISIAGAVIADLYEEKDRAPATAIYGLGLLLGPPTGPVIGGYIAQTVGFKYGFVLTSALSGVATVLSFVFLPETYHDTIRGKYMIESGTDNEPDGEGMQTSKNKKWNHVWESAARPFVLLTRSYICLILSFYGALVYGYLNMFFTSFPSIFGEIYGFKPGATGLTYIAGGLGEITATIVGGLVGNRIYLKLTEKNDGKAQPEFRMPGMFIGSVAVPIGLFWFGWTADAHTHWILPVLGSAIFGFGMMSILLPMQLYIVDAFHYAASALAAASILRSLLAFAIPLFAPQMISAMGLGGTYSLLGGLSIVIGIPLPIWIYLKGHDIRARSPLSN